MARRIGRTSKIAERLDQALTEMMLPNAVDHHPRRQRMLRVDQPPRYTPAAARGTYAPDGGGSMVMDLLGSVNTAGTPGCTSAPAF